MTLGMTTVLVAAGVTDHPEHQAIAGWARASRRTSITAPMRSPPSSPTIGAALAQDERPLAPTARQRQFCLT